MTFFGQISIRICVWIKIIGGMSAFWEPGAIHYNNAWIIFGCEERQFGPFGYRAWGIFYKEPYLQS